MLSGTINNTPWHCIALRRELLETPVFLFPQDANKFRHCFSLSRNSSGKVWRKSRSSCDWESYIMGDFDRKNKLVSPSLFNNPDRKGPERLAEQMGWDLGQGWRFKIQTSGLDTSIRITGSLALLLNWGLHVYDLVIKIQAMIVDR